MPFEPKSGQHAIIEAVFGLQFARPFSQAVIEQVVAAHGEWQDHLPRLARSGAFQVVIGSFGLPPPDFGPFGGGVTFERVKPDGALAWRLKVEGNSIFVNCLEYEGWTQVWAKVRPLLHRVTQLVDADGDNPVVSSILQYIDVFEWQGDAANYDASQLLRAGALVTEPALSRGPFWHLHQGWFREDNRLGNGRLLERLHIDSVADERGTPTVKFDSYLAFTPQEPHATQGGKLLVEGSLGVAWFGTLHDLDKELLASAITSEQAKKIGLVE